METYLPSICIAGVLLAACGSLEKKSMLVSVGDTKEQVAARMGAPDDRQVKDANEAWQYCQTGAGFGWHDYRVIWFKEGKVTGLDSYKSTRPGSSCMADIKPVKWEEAPHTIVEIRNR
jgi:hypothetical protein